MEEKKWVLKEQGYPEQIEKLAEKLDIDRTLAQLLVQRNITTYDEAKAFFRPELEDLHDPFLMVDMQKAVERIDKAFKNNERILVYGDYDVDGTTSVAMMYSFLRKFHQQIEYYIPDRYTEGYGISEKSILHAEKNNISLVIALDCGIKAIEKIKMANQKNIDYIICDHHTPDEILPAAHAILDPKRPDSNYPFKELSGCGVGFKLVQGFLQYKNKDMELAYEYLDILAVSIASDIVPLIGENRVLAHYGLKKINQNPSVAMKAVMEVSELDKHIVISDIVFKIGPRLNAAGRMDSGQKAVDLMVCTDLDEARIISSSINDENNNRKDIDRQITSEALDVVIQEKLQDKKTIVLYNPQWLKGVIGIVASRLVEHYYKPTIIFTRSNGLITGSARSVNGFNIYNAITECGDLLENYGGHMYAAGLSIKEENFNIFKKRFEEIVESRIKPDQTIQKIHVDAAISLNQITDKFFRILKQFEPFGPENMTPVFITENLYDSGFSRTVGKDGKHIKLMLTDKKGGDTLFPSIAFNQAEHYLHVSNKENFSICYSIDENTFRNKTNLQLRIKDIHFKKYESAPNREEPIKTTTMTIAEIKTKINEIWENRTKLKEPESQQLITEVINMLDAGEIRVAEQVNEEWVINEWVKKAVVLYFPMRTMETIEVGPFEFHDKIPLKHGYKEKGVRVVPHAIARHGSYVAKDVIMMPSYINIGAYVDTGTMVDTWATVGSCAQIGRNVHLSGGVGIGGVLEPLQATPVIIEDGAFIGSRCVVVEGVHIKKEAVLGANVVLTKTTKIIDVTGSEPKEFSGVIPERSVVIPGSIPKKFNAGTYNVPCALIIGKRKESTDKKTSLNEALREHNVAI